MRIQLAFFTFSLIILTTGCKTEGCTDPYASNFSYEADKDDGSCKYNGCTDPNALNYDPDAKDDDGSCKYLGNVMFITKRQNVGINNTFLEVKVNGEFIGNLASKCTAPFVDCNTPCEHLKFFEKPSGSYTFQFWEIRQAGSTSPDTIFESSHAGFQVEQKACIVVVID